MKSFLLTVVVIVLLAGGSFYYFASNEAPKEADNSQEVTPEPEPEEDEPKFDKTEFSIDDPDSIWLVVNKQRPIPLDYTPEDLIKVEAEKRRDKSDEELMLRREAAKALESMFAAAIGDEVPLILGSGYRSADLQQTYYSNYVANFGQAEADKFSAQPGTSEHQTGLSADVSGINLDCYLEICFGETAEGQWLKANAHDFGFTIRYPEGKEAITGYQYEPWHLRFVGQKLAKELNRENMTMEEFFEIQN